MQLRAGAQEHLGQLSTGVYNVFTVVQDQQQALVPEVMDESLGIHATWPVSQAQGGRDTARNK